ncbi:MAG: transcription antitermination factor NusB [Rhodothermaceae bacterium]
MSEKKSNRRVLREISLQALYAYEMNGEGLSNIVNGLLTDITNETDREFARELVDKAVANKNVIDEMIQGRVNNWEMERIALIDKLLLRIGIAELLYFYDIPPKVSINEVIEISKNFSTSNSNKFINGILDAILNELKKSGKLKKAGRGLIDESLSKNN